MEDMGNTPARAATCRHPAIGARDDTQTARATDQYATRHNPFVYFHSIIDNRRAATRDVVPLDQLTPTCSDRRPRPNYAFITPDLCSDGHDTPCVDGGPGGLESVDVFLKEWVPKIVASPAYKDGGMLFITWDEAEFPRAPRRCCGQPTGPNTPSPGDHRAGRRPDRQRADLTVRQAGLADGTQLNHYSLLRSVEDIFGLEYLGYAGLGTVKTFTFDEPGPGSSRLKGCTRGGAKAVSGLRLARHEEQALLELRTLKAGTLTVSKGKRVLKGPTKLKACREYRVAIPAGHNKLKIAVKAGGKTERYKLNY